MQNKEKIIKNEKKKLESGFFGFWTDKLRVSILVLILLIIGWFFSVSMIPKEAFPKVDLGYINITTIYNWVSPNDIDSLITEKIEKNIKEIDGIKKITSTSSVWVSSIQIEVKSGYDSTDVLNEVKSEVDKVSLPANAEEPSVTELDIVSDAIFSVYLYGDEKKYSLFDLMQKAKILEQKLETNPYISKVTVSPSGDYEIKVLIDKAKLEQTGISISEISNIVNQNNRNTPIWNYEVWDLSYDFRFEWELKDIDDLRNISIKTKWSSSLKLWDIAEIELDYKTKNINKFWSFEKTWFNYVSLMVEKASFASVFSWSEKAKEQIKDIFENDLNFKWLSYEYSLDLWENIKEQYLNLASTARQTLLLVFLTILFFISFRESLIATVILPLSFFVTFIFLYYAGYTLNTLVNFSLILALTICIDTIIVIVEWATEKQKMWYSKKYAVLMSIQEYKAPLISWTLTTLVVFLPMLSLPWVLWKFLSYIPVTVFSTLLAWLIIALTISSAVYMMLASEKNTFHRDEEVEKSLTEEEKIFLESEREWKTEVQAEKLTTKQKFLQKMWKKYFSYLENTLKSKSKKRIIIISPIILTILSFIFLSPQIWFSLFPGSEKWQITVTVEGKEGQNEKSLEKYLPELEQKISSISEIKTYWVSVSWKNISISVELVDEDKRIRKATEVEKDIYEKILFLEQNWLKTSVETAKNWPPSTGWAIWVKLIANSSQKLDDLKKVADDFEKYFKSLEWTKNVKKSSSDTPWQFVFQFDKNKLSELWLNPNDILWELYSYIWWLKSGSIKSDLEDNDIILKIKEFEDGFTPEDLSNIVVNTRVWKVRIWDVASYDFTKAVSSVSRENWKISITVSSDLEEWFTTSALQIKITDFTEKYNYPDWVSYEAGGENAENADLITAMISALFIAVFLMFFILVIQFNSYKQPLLILFSIILSLVWINIWLFLTWTSYSMMFMIWFVSLAWIVINDAILLIDTANKNIEKWLEPIFAISEAWRSRLQPVLVTTITTVLWVIPLALQDAMWAWLGYTILFWIMTWSFLTLFCIPLIYHNQYLKKNWEKGRWIFKTLFLIITFPLRKIFFIISKRKRKKS